MLFKKQFFILLFSFLFISFLTAKPAFADSFTVSGSVKDSSGNAISGTTVSVNDTLNTSTTTDDSGNYTVLIQQGIYDINVTPPSNSNFSSAIALSQNINKSTILNFVLVPQGTITISGTLYDASETPLPGQSVKIFATGNNLVGSTTTDELGKYSFVGAPSSYQLDISSTSENSSGSMPEKYQLATQYRSYSKSTIQNITIPAKRVNIHVQNEASIPVQNISLSTGADLRSQNNLDLGSGLLATGNNGYPHLVYDLTTDESGNATMWLFPGTNPYTITATPPSGAEVGQTIVTNNIIADNTDLTISMQPLITISGTVYDASDLPLPGQSVKLYAAGNNLVGSTTTDELGKYSFKTSSNSYQLDVSSTPENSSGSMPEKYQLTTQYRPYSQDTVQNINIPAKRVNIHVQNAANASIANVSLTTGGDLKSQNNLNVANGVLATGNNGYPHLVYDLTTDESGNATMWLFPGTNPYTITATPPSGLGVGQTIVPNNIITNDTDLTINMQPVVIISGTVYDASNLPFPGQAVRLYATGNNLVGSTITNELGQYSFEASPNTYQLDISSTLEGSNGSAPKKYQLLTQSRPYNQSTIQNITIPAKQISFHVQDGSNSAIENVGLTTGVNLVNQNNLNVGNGILASGNNGYMDSELTTDESGNVTMWLFPGINPYTINANPQSDSAFSQFILNNVSVQDNQNLLVSLQYNHSVPITTIDLTTQNVDGTYSNPTTVTISATAALGYSIGNTYYKIDHGAQQTYNNPFTVSGDGEHIVEYWSVDTSGARESVKTRTFIVYANQPPDVDTLPNVTINEGVFYTAVGSFTDADSNAWTATVDYDEGAGPESLQLNGTSFVLNNKYETPGTYTAQVVVTDEHLNTGTILVNVTVNAKPVIAALEDTALNEGSNYAFNGTFTDQDSDEWMATVDYGDGTGSQALLLSGTTFSLNHIYKDNGTYTISVTVTDNDGASRTRAATATVANRNPVIGTITASVNPIFVNTSTTASASFTDVGVLDTQTAIWDWGDGTQSVANVSGSNGGFTVSNGHTYTTVGIYTITLAVTDKDNGQQTQEYQYLTVFNPTSDKVAGSKEYQSPAGALISNPSLTGTMDFGFRVEYINGSLTQSSQALSLSFAQANIDFVSTSYQWLVVVNSKATVKATGTLNGVPGYTALVSAIDQGTGQQKGLIRVQIKASNNTVIYDTQPGAADTANPTLSVSKGKISVQ